MHIATVCIRQIPQSFVGLRNEQLAFQWWVRLIPLYQFIYLTGTGIASGVMLPNMLIKIASVERAEYAA